MLSRDARRYAESGKNPDDLWRGTPLRRALKLQAAGQLALSSAEEEFLRSSAQEAGRHQALLEEQARQQRDRDLGFGETARTILVLSLVAFGVGTYAWARISLQKISHELFLILKNNPVPCRAIRRRALSLGVLGILWRGQGNCKENRRFGFMSVSKKTLIISDLHLGNGGTYDIFAGGEALPALLQRFAAPGNTVILNGDSVDFLMNEDPLELDEKRAPLASRADLF